MPITESDLKGDISAVSKIPRIERDMEETADEMAELRKALKKVKTNVQGWKDLQALEKVQEKAQAQIDAIEQELAEELTKSAKRLELIEDSLKPLQGADVPAEIRDAARKRTAIAQGARARDLAYLETLSKKKGLRTEPAKLKRLAEELNDDKREFNLLDAAVDEAIDREYAQKWERFEKSLSGKVSLDSAASRNLSDTFKQLKNTRWKNFDKVQQKLEAELLAAAAESKRRVAVEALRSSFVKLDPRKLGALMEFGRDSPTKPTAIQMKTALQAALDKQRRPDKSRWALFLKMTSYQVVKTGERYDNIPIHITFDKNSWSPEAAAGTIDVSSGNADQVLEQLFGIADWTYQAHVTLELKASNDKYPHVYWGGHSNHWERLEDKDAAWRTKGIAKLKSVMDAKKAELRKLVQQAIDLEGRI